MKLSTKFVLLVVGTVIIPIITLSLIFLLIQLNFDSHDTNSPKAFTMVRIRELLHGVETHPTEPGQLIQSFRALSPEVRIAIYDKERQLIYSSFETLVLQDLLTPVEGRKSYNLSQSRIRSSTGENYFLIVGFLFWEADAFSLPVITVLSFFGSILLFTILMSVLIIRSINVSIAGLEKATRRVSAGDLDFVLPVKGNDSLASLTRSFNTMRERVKEETAARSRFIMAVSHDLKTPLASITGYLDAIRDGMAAGRRERDEYLAIIRSKADLLASRISQLIDYIKLETSEWKHARQDVVLADFLEEARTIFGAEAEVRGFTFEGTMDIARELRVPMDQDLVFHALENLVHNAFSYADAGSCIRFQVSQEESRVIIRLINKGSGIIAGDLPFIFEPFYRGTRSRRESGFGLGLAVVKSVVSSHDWEIDVHSGDGETCFTIRINLPAKKNINLLS